MVFLPCFLTSGVGGRAGQEECLHAAVRVVVCSPSPILRTFNGAAPWPAKSCTAAYAAGLAAHLLRRPAALLQSLSYRTLSLASRINAPVDRRSPLLSVQTVMPRKGAIFPPIAPTSLSDQLFLSFPPQPGPLIFPWLVVVAAPLQVAAAARTAAATATSTILGFFSRARAVEKVHLGAGAGLLRV